jgi:hypothetical protein
MEDVLHAIRVKGIATPEAIVAATGLEPGAVQAALAQLDAEGLAFERPSRKRPGWVLSEEGRERHAAWLADAHDEAALGEIAGHYEGFLAINGEVKAVSARWQHVADDAQRFALMDRIEDLHGQAAPVLRRAGDVRARYARYGDRLGAALERLEDDPRYFVSPLVDSYHTVWFECHEDFLLTLRRTRAGEGSE